MIRRLAGALLLTLAGAPSPTVLMIQRPRSMRHFPGVWSFPGGRVEASDREGREWVSPAVAGTSPCLSTESYLHRWDLSAPPIHAWLPHDDPGAVETAARAAWREVQEELGPDISSVVAEERRMQYLGRLSPPPSVEFGFDTRFFSLAVRPFRVVPEPDEVAQACWLRVSAVLEGGLEMAKPTQYVLERLEDCLGSQNA